MEVRAVSSSDSKAWGFSEVPEVPSLSWYAESHDATDEEECGTQESVVSAYCPNACWRALLDGKEAVKDAKVMGRERKLCYCHKDIISSKTGEIISLAI